MLFFRAMCKTQAVKTKDTEIKIEIDVIGVCLWELLVTKTIVRN